MTGGTLVASWLKAQGVDTIFVLVGEHILPFVDGCTKAGIEMIGTRHEQGAVLMAEAYARVTGRPGVAAVTAGPGVTNAVTGLAVANTCGSPVLLIAGRTSTAKRLTGTFQDIDGTAITKAVTKWNETVFLPDRIPDYLAAAWRRMLAGRPGAVMLEIPHDVQRDAVEDQPERLTLPEPPGASPEALSRALEMLAQAERPVLIAGSGAFWAGGGDALRSFAERTHIPCTAVNAARGLLPDGHEASLGPLSEAGPILMQADIVVLAGTKLDASVAFGGPPLFSGSERFLQIDIESPAMGLNRTPALGLIGDVRVVLSQLADGWDAKLKDEWLAQAKELGGHMHAAWAAQSVGEGSPVPPGRVVGEIVAAAGRDAILVSDGGDIHTWAVTTFPAYAPGSLLTTHDALGTIGVGVPYGVGAKAAARDRTVIVLIGDGSFGFGAMELETAARHDLPVVFVIANNGAWGNIRHEEGRQFQHSVATALSVASYEKIAEAFGGYGERVEDAAEVGPAIRRAIESGRLAVVNVITEPGVVSPVTEMLGGMMAML